MPPGAGFVSLTEAPDLTPPAAHESPRPTKFYGHTGNRITLGEVDRIGI